MPVWIRYKADQYITIFFKLSSINRLFEISNKTEDIGTEENLMNQTKKIQRYRYL